MHRHILGAMVLFVYLVIPQFAIAQEPPFDIGDPVVSGNGCPEGSYEVSLSANGSELFILFNKFTAMTDESDNYDFSNCNIAIPIEVPDGVSISLSGINYQGIAFIPTGGSGTLHREYFFAGMQGPEVTSEINVYDEYYPFSYSDMPVSTVWTECGDDVIARSNATVHAYRPVDGLVQASMSVLSEDWNPSGIGFLLRWKYCDD